MRRIVTNLIVELTVVLANRVKLADVINELNYDFKSGSAGARVTDMEIINHEVTQTNRVPSVPLEPVPAPAFRDTFFVRYKNRVPDPGVCRVISCDWERKTLTVSNGACRFSPSFDEVI